MSLFPGQRREWPHHLPRNMPGPGRHGPRREAVQGSQASDPDSLREPNSRSGGADLLAVYGGFSAEPHGALAGGCSTPERRTCSGSKGPPPPEACFPRGRRRSPVCSPTCELLDGRYLSWEVWTWGGWLGVAVRAAGGELWRMSCFEVVVTRACTLVLVICFC